MSAIRKPSPFLLCSCKGNWYKFEGKKKDEFNIRPSIKHSHILVNSILFNNLVKQIIFSLEKGGQTTVHRPNPACHLFL